MRSGLASSLAGTTQQGTAIEQVQPATNRRRIVAITTVVAGLTLAVVAGLRRRAANRD